MKAETIRVRPTGLWVIFGPVIACMWIAAVNYANNLVYAILYLVAALSFISLFHTWRNLAAVRVEHLRVQPAFAGEDVRVEIHLRNLSRNPVYGLTFARLGEEGGQWWRPWQTRLPLADLIRARRMSAMRTVEGRMVRIEAQDTIATEAAFASEHRGVYRFETLVVRTYYPFGLFWASIRVPIGAEYYVYPKPKGTSGWPGLRAGAASGLTSSLRPGDDFAGVRAYVPGESLRHVDWKAFARGRPLAVKQFTGGAGHELWLDAADMSRLPLEQKLSQLALWIVNAEKEEIPYALRMGRTVLPLGLGPAHLRRALEALAVAGAGST